jgi:PST family polysaccharide transporter
MNSILWVGSTKGFGQLISWILTIIIARLLAPSDFGLISMALVFMFFAESFSEIGIGTFIVQKEKLEKADLDTSFWLAIISGFLLTIVTLFLAPVIAWFFKVNKLEEILRVLSINFIFISLSIIPLNLLNKEFEFKKRSITEFSTDLLSSLLAVLLAFRGLGVWSLVVRSISKWAMLTILIYIIQPWRPGFFFSREKIGELYKFCAPVTGSRLLWSFYANSDYLIVGRALGEHFVGLYRVAYLLARKPLEKLMLIVGDLILPAFSKVKLESDKAEILFKKLSKYVSIAIFPANIGLILISQDGISIVLGEKWVPMTTAFQLLCLLSILKTLDIGVAPLFNSLGKPSQNFRFDILSCIFIPASLIVGVHFGLEGVCIGWITSYAVMAVVRLRFALKELNLSWRKYLYNLKDPVLGTILMAATVLLCQISFLELMPPVIRLIGTCFIGSLSYLTYMILFCDDVRYAFNGINGSIKRRRGKYVLG